MNILVVAPYFPPEVTGSSNFVSDLATGLIDLGHSVRVVTATENASSPSCDVVVLKARTIRPGKIAFNYVIPTVLSRRNVSVLRNLMDEFEPDLISLHGQIFDITLLTALIGRKRGIPTVMTVHSAIWHDNKIFNLILGIADHLLARVLLRRVCDRWIAVDGRTRQHVERRYSGKRKVVTIPICVRRGVFKNGNKQVAVEKYGINGDPVVASVGHVVPVRDRVALVNALPILAESFPGIEVVVVGRVADDSFLQRAEELGVSRHLRVIGAVPHADISNILAASDVEVHDIQGFSLGIASLEPIDAGVPIVAFVRDDNLDDLDMQDICPEGLIPDNNPETLASAITRVLSEPEFRDALIKGQQRLLEEAYYLDVVAKKYEREFTRLLRR